MTAQPSTCCASPHEFLRFQAAPRPLRALPTRFLEAVLKELGKAADAGLVASLEGQLRKIGVAEVESQRLAQQAAKLRDAQREQAETQVRAARAAAERKAEEEKRRVDMEAARHARAPVFAAFSILIGVGWAVALATKLHTAMTPFQLGFFVLASPALCYWVGLAVGVTSAPASG